MLPTVVGDQYDIDLAFLRRIPKESTNQAGRGSREVTKLVVEHSER